MVPLRIQIIEQALDAHRTNGVLPPDGVQMGLTHPFEYEMLHAAAALSQANQNPDFFEDEIRYAWYWVTKKSDTNPQTID